MKTNLPQRKLISRFSPNRTAPEDLEKIHVQRHELLNHAVELLRESALTANKHHLLFVGPRGCGKTHLLSLIDYRLGKQEDLRDRLRIAWLNEDESSDSFLDLLLRIYRALSKRYPSEFPKKELESIYGSSPAEGVNLLGQAIVRLAGKRTILVLLENMDSLFKELDETGQRSWRGFIQNHPIFATCATAQSLFDGVTGREKPFFGFFDTQHLQMLTPAEAATLLEHIAHLNGDTKLADYLRTPNGRARIRAIHHLSGGNHRLYIVLSDFLDAQSLEDLVRPFEELVDEQLTPYYQERLRWLSAQQRKIVEFLCRRSQPAPVKEIAEQLFAEHGSITGQLKKLREMGYVQSNTRGRESLYELAEPLMRLSMQVKDAQGHQPLEMIVDFLRIWYERQELEQRLARLGPSAHGRDYFVAALTKLQSGEPNLRHEILRHALEDVDVEHCNDLTVADLEALAHDTQAPADWLKYGRACNFRKQYSKAIEAFTRIIEMPDAPVDMVCETLVNRGIAFGNAGQTEIELADYTQMIELRNAPLEQACKALINRGAVFGKMGETEKAVSDFARVIEIPNAPVDQVCDALFNRGAVFFNAGETKRAILEFTRIIEMPNARLEQICDALITRGAVFAIANEIKEELSDYTRVIELPNAPLDQVCKALIHRGMAFGKSGEIEKELSDYKRVIEMPNAPLDQICTAFNNQGVAIGKSGKPGKALSEFTRIIEMPNAPAEVVCVALVNRSVAFGESGQIETALSDCTRVIEMPGASESMRSRARALLVVFLFWENRWNQAVDQLKQLTAFDNKTTLSAISAIFRSIASPGIWERRVDELTTLCAEKKLLAQLGDALVRHLPDLGASVVKGDGLDQWVARWEMAAAEHPPLKLPARLLRVGVAYFKTGSKDKGVLLDLPQEERRLLRSALKLPEEG